MIPRLLNLLIPRSLAAMRQAVPLCLVLSVFCGSAVAATHTNVLFILADDLGWSDTTLYGTTKLYQTPNIERLAQRGVTFTRAYSASPLCSPTRSAILTGLSPARTGITTPNCHLPKIVLTATPGKSAPPNQPTIQPDPVTRLKTDYPSLSTTLKTAGYATAHFGKWHLGPAPYSPLEHGFDVDIPHWPGPGPAGSFVAPWKYPNFKENSPGEHIEDRMAKEAVAWMEQNKDRPFFVNYWQFSVHAPFDAKSALIEKYRPLVDPSEPQRSPTYAAMIESFDDAIGTLLDALDRLQLAEKTLIVFTSDNGGNMYNEVDGTTPTSNRPLRGGKATMFEGGCRVPQIIAWPGITSPGTRSECLTQSEDFYPTVLEGLGLAPSPGQTFDGVSLLPALKGGSIQREAVFQYFPHAPGVPDWLPPSVSVQRQDGWKLIRLFHAGANASHRHLLFNLSSDIGEQTNLATAEPLLVKELDALIDAFLTDTQAVLPIPNPAFDPSKYRPELEGVQTNKKAAKNAGSAAGPDHATVGGWQTSKDTRLEVTQSALRITSTGNDPWISTRKIAANAKGPFTVSLTLSSTSQGKGVIYFANKEHPNYNLARSANFEMKHDGQGHDYEIHLPTPSLTAIRLDPGNAKGHLMISKMTLHDSSGAVVNSWPAQGKSND